MDKQNTEVVESPPEYTDAKTEKPQAERKQVDASKPTSISSSSSKDTKKKSIITTLHRRTPVSSSSKPGYITVDAIEATVQDILLLTSATTYSELTLLLTKRAEAKDLIPVVEQHRRYIVVGIKPDAKSLVALDAGNWEAGKQMLFEREDASLVFGVAVVEEGFEQRMREIGNVEEAIKVKKGKKQGGKCVVQ